MRIGFIGLGAVVNTAYLPALQGLGLQIEAVFGFDVDALRSPDGVCRSSSMEALFDESPDLLFVTTSSVNHLAVLEQALASSAQRIVVEKPVVANLEQVERLRSLFEYPAVTDRVLALDHWMARTAGLAQGRVGEGWLPVDVPSQGEFTFALNDIACIEGFLQEPSGFNETGEPIALNFATGAPDTRQLCHPDGVILDIGTHVLALMRELVHALGGGNDLELVLLDARDRLGKSIVSGDVGTAEGEAQLEGMVGGIPVRLWLNKYAGPAGGRKGICVHLRDGRTISQDMRDDADVIELLGAGQVSRWRRAGGIYGHCIAELLLGPDNLFEMGSEQMAAMTRRRLAEVEALLRIQQDLRGVH